MMPIQMKNVQPQPPKEPLSEGKDAAPAVPLPAKMEAPAQVKEASEVVTSEVVPCPAAGSIAAATSTSISTSDCSTADPASQSGADDDAAKGEEAQKDVLEAEAALEGIIKLLEIK